MSLIIGFTGKARHGKSTCADYLVDNYGFVKINFKDALVKEMEDRLPDTLQALLRHYGVYDDIDSLFMYKPPVMRALMQNYGSEVRRRDDPNYWIKQWNKAVSRVLTSGKDIVVDDCRFLNEANAVKIRGGIIVKVVCMDCDSVDNPTHISETEMDSIEPDGIVGANKGDVEGLYGMVAELIYQYE